MVGFRDGPSPDAHERLGRTPAVVGAPPLRALLGGIARRYRTRPALTYGLTAIENVCEMLYPWPSASPSTACSPTGRGGWRHCSGCGSGTWPSACSATSRTRASTPTSPASRSRRAVARGRRPRRDGGAGVTAAIIGLGSAVTMLFVDDPVVGAPP